MKSDVALQLRFGNECLRGRECFRIQLDRLEHRAPPALPPHGDDRVANVRADFEEVARSCGAHEDAFELGDLRISDRMAVLRSELLHARQQRIAR